jgi:hypothetical protein
VDLALEAPAEADPPADQDQAGSCGGTGDAEPPRKAGAGNLHEEQAVGTLAERVAELQRTQDSVQQGELAPARLRGWPDNLTPPGMRCTPEASALASACRSAGHGYAAAGGLAGV